MSSEREEQLESLVEAVLASPKYRQVSADLVRAIAEQEIAKRQNTKETVKAIKNRLHQAGGAYQSGKETYVKWLAELNAALQSGNRETLLATSQRIMSHHASTRERLPILDRFYSTIFASLPPVSSVIDVACGLNPLALPWMPLAPGATYVACDIYADMIDFLNGFFALLQKQSEAAIAGSAQVRNILTSCPAEHADVAFVLKTIPCLEQVDKAAGHRLLRALNADYLVVSFPVHSLGGRNKGMLTNYERHFRELIEGESWEIQRIEFPGELVFLVKKEVGG
jgi:16S rRNA (guanine(1405)-N(7))-methyltransferase